MKSRHEKMLIRLLLLVGILITTISSSLLFYGNLRIIGLPNETEIVEDSTTPLYSVPLSDLYGSKAAYDLSEFMEREGVLDDLLEINDRLAKSQTFEYYQITEPSIYYIGSYHGQSQTIVGGEECRNQKDIDTGESLTSLNSFEVSENIMKQIDSQIEKGQAFLKDDFSLTCTDEIPIVLGSAYGKDITVGDTFNMRYYLSQIKVKVIGVLEEGASMVLPSITMDLDGYVVLPDIKIARNAMADKTHNVIMMLEKNEGYLGIYQLSDFDKVIAEINEIKEKYNFALNTETIKKTYEYLKGQNVEAEDERVTKNTEQSKDDINHSMSKAMNTILNLLIFLGVACTGVAICIWPKVLANRAHDVRSVVFKTKAVINLGGNVIGAYIISYVICILVLKKAYENFTYEFIAYPQSWIRLGLVIAIIVGSIILCKMIDKKDKKGEGEND
ncbi:hypothetical protein M2140_000185 [Clostridiales Family XIII bacterium PM5-7]